MIKHHDPEFETVIDNHRPRFGTVRWFLVRRLLAALNLVEGRFAALREWALQEAVECGPDFQTFGAWCVEHYAARGMKATVTINEAVVPPLPVPNAIATSAYLQQEAMINNHQKGILTMNNTITINGTEYAPVQPRPTGTRAVVVVDRGWIFAGDVKRENGRIHLSRAVWVFKWESIGFAKLVETEKGDLRPIADVDMPEDAEIFCVPVHDGWGLK